MSREVGALVEFGRIAEAGELRKLWHLLVERGADARMLDGHGLSAVERRPSCASCGWRAGSGRPSATGCWPAGAAATAPGATRRRGG